MNVSAVFAIQTQGRNATFERWAFTYRVEYSEDCNTFNKVLDVATGLDQVRKRSWIVCCLHLKIEFRSCARGVVDLASFIITYEQHQ